MHALAGQESEYFCQDEGAENFSKIGAPPRNRLKPGMLRGFTLGGHRLSSLYRAPINTRLRLMRRKGLSSWQKYSTGAWGCETLTSLSAKGLGQ